MLDDMNNTGVTLSAYGDSLAFVECAEQAFSLVEEEWKADRPNSSIARHQAQRANHFRELAQIHADLAVAQQIREASLAAAARAERPQVIRG